MVHEVVVGDGDESRTPNGVDQAIGSFGQEAVVDPDVVAGEDANGIPVGSPAFPTWAAELITLAGPVATMS
jgi:hypothetical protein